MRIAIVSTSAVSTPPHGYGGTELVMAELAKGLGENGHDVTVFATGDSHPHARLRAHFAKPVWPPNDLAEMRHSAYAFRHMLSRIRAYDMIHLNHGVALPFTVLQSVPSVFTIHHSRSEALVDHYRSFPDVAFVAISDRQGALLPELPIARVIHHGLDPTRYREGDGRGGYAAFLGRLSHEKAPHLAIDAALKTQTSLRLAGEPHDDDREYFANVVAPLFAKHPTMVPLGNLGHDAKVELLRGAQCLLFPLAWDEPFGLVMIEAMLVGTPVIAYARGSAPEVIDEGVTGHLVRSVDEMAQRIRDVKRLDRKRCRTRAQERWSHRRMARDYERLYTERTRRTMSSVAPRRGEHGRAIDNLGR